MLFCRFKINKRAIFVCFLIFLTMIGLAISLILPKTYPLGETEAQRRAYIYSLGYRLAEDKPIILDKRLPSKMNKAFSDYNSIQIAAGFDLSKFCSRRVRLYCYDIRDEGVITLIVLEGKIIGGDLTDFSKMDVVKSIK